MLFKLFKDHYHYLDPHHYLDPWKHLLEDHDKKNMNEDPDKILWEIFERF